MPPKMPIEEIAAAQEAMIESCIQHWPGLPEVVQQRVMCDEVAAVWYRPPAAAPNRVILYVHGGGYVWGSAEDHVGIISRVAARSESNVLALDYKSAPTHPFPGPVNEAVALYQWLLKSDYVAQNIAVVGDSAGGGLALALIYALKCAGVPLPACAAVSSPYTDLTNSGESIDWVTKDRCVSREGLDACVEMYLQGHDPSDPLASPLHADLTGFPPTLLQVGSRERLLSDSTRFAAKLDAVGADVTLEVYDGCVHLWQWWVPDSDEAKAAIDSISEFVAQRTRP